MVNSARLQTRKLAGARGIRRRPNKPTRGSKMKALRMAMINVMMSTRPMYKMAIRQASEIRNEDDILTRTFVMEEVSTVCKTLWVP